MLRQANIKDLKDAIQDLDHELDHGRLEDLENELQDLQLEISMVGMASS